SRRRMVSMPMVSGRRANSTTMPHHAAPEKRCPNGVHHGHGIRHALGSIENLETYQVAAGDGVHDWKVEVDAIHQQNGLNLSVCPTLGRGRCCGAAWYAAAD